MKRHGFAVVLLGTAIIGTGCEGRATSEHAQAAPAASERWHSCANSADCAEGTHCAESVCVPSQKVPEGDFYAALGAELGDNGDWEGAIEAYAKATSILEAAGQKHIAEVHCAHGEALIKAGGDPQRSELAARVLHRCLLSVPRHTALHRRANRGLAVLRQQGLDPVHITRDSVADRYLTAAPSKPRSSNLQLTISSPKPYKHRTYNKFVAMLGEEPVSAALGPCWNANWKATRSATMVVTLNVKHSYRVVETEDDDIVKTTIEVLPSTGSGPGAAAATCVKNAITPIVTEYASSRRDERRWQVPIKFTVAAEK